MKVLKPVALGTVAREETRGLKRLTRGFDEHGGFDWYWGVKDLNWPPM